MKLIILPSSRLILLSRTQTSVTQNPAVAPAVLMGEGEAEGTQKAHQFVSAQELLFT